MISKDHFWGVLIVFIVSVGLSLPLFAAEGERTLENLVYVELERESDLEQVSQLPNHAWTPLRHQHQGLGFSESYYWFKADIRGNSQNREWMLRYSYPLLDYLEIHLLDRQGDLVLYEVVGDIFPYEKREFLERAFAFKLDLEPDQNYQIFLKAYTKGSMQMPLTLSSVEDYQQQVKFEELFAIAFFSVLIAMAIYNLLIWLLVRDTGYLYYVFYLLSLLNTVALLQGWFFKFVMPNSPVLAALFIPFGVALSQTIGFLFVTDFLRVKAKTGMTRLMFRLIVFVSGATAVSAFVLPYDFSIRLVAVNFYLCVLTGLALIIYDWIKNRRREVSIFLVAWSAMFTGILLFLSASFGLLPYNAFTQHAVQIGAMLEVVILALGLAERINHERREAEHAKELVLDAQIRSNRELDQRVKDRTRELEELTEQLEIASITDSLTGLKNRRYFDSNYYQEFARSYRAQTPLTLLLLDLDHFKRINDRYGHQAGDMVLEEVAKLLGHLIRRPADTVCRYGGEEFIATLANTDKDGAMQLAGKILESMRSMELDWNGLPINVTASIGLVSTTPSESDTPASLLMRADNCLYSAKEAGRDRVALDTAESV